MTASTSPPRLFADVLQSIGRTPVVALERLSPPGIALCAKLEARNPGGSVKDRMALAIIEDAERRGVLRPGMTVFEASSGNTGIALAMVCARKGYPLVVTMAENFSVERRRLMRWFGAKVVLTPAAEKGSGMLRKARELAAAHGGFLCRQFEHPANPAAHQRGTAQEILRDFAGQRLDAVVSGFGTGGSLLGIARELRVQRPEVRIIACEPDNADMLGSAIAQPRDAEGQPEASHPQFRPHPMQGWSPDFLSPLIEQARDQGLIDALQPVSGDEALSMARELARQEGILAGISSGATAAAAARVGAGLPPGSVVLCLLADSAERYLSTPLFVEIAEGMDETEWSLSRSTPSARFDRPGAATPNAVCRDAQALGWADARLAEWQAEGATPLRLFALGWCEFGWSLRRFLDALSLPYRMIELDAPALREGQRALALRQRLREASGQSTLPQLQLGAQWLGGCQDVFARYRDGGLQRDLAAAGLPPVRGGLDTDRFLPGWTQSATVPLSDATPCVV